MTELGGFPLTLHLIEQVIFANATTSIAPEAMKKLEAGYDFIVSHADNDKPIYGLNTGFGALAEKRISRSDQSKLQHNIILSHAVGVGDPLDFFVAKTLMLLRLNTLVQGHSGASPQLIKHLVALLNNNCAPFVPKRGSVGASGDLAPLAHVGLLCLGIGEAFIDQKPVKAKDALAHAKLSPLTLGMRDGLALINGTQAMTAVAIMALKKSKELSTLSDITAAGTLDALAGHVAPFDARIHDKKPHPGQIRTAQNIRAAIKGRSVEKHQFNLRTQDPYSLRCVPQVHGATKDVIAHVEEVLSREINAVTDNPLFFIDFEHETLDILSGGNFHGQHLAFILDYLAMGIAELANISERRIDLLQNTQHSNGLPPFLIEGSGLNSGYMMLHVTASALVNENKILCHPASTDSIPTSAGREDHVSMGMTSANKLWQILENTKTVLAIEIMASHQALDLRPKDFGGDGVKKVHASLREVVSFRREDGLYKDDITNTLSWLSQPITKQLFNEVLDAEKT